MYRTHVPFLNGFGALLLTSIGLAFLAACGGSPEGPLSPVAEGAGFGDHVAAGEAPITLEHEAVLAFQSDWNTVLSNGPVMAGGTLRIDYDPARLPSCRGTKYGLPAWSILLYWKTPSGDAKYVALAKDGAVMRATIEVPEAADSIELWFLNNDYYGCKEWDSNQGANYEFGVVPPALPTPVVFTGQWEEQATSPIVAGGQLLIDYAPERLQACRYAPGGARAWNIFASWSFAPGGQTGTVALYDGDVYAGESAILHPAVAVPHDATSVALWFSSSDATGCVSWDSNFGENYVFPVEADASAGPAVGWVGDFDFVKVGSSEQHLGDVDPVYYWDSWTGIPLASRVEVQVWIPGLSDQAYASQEQARATAEAAVVAQVVTPAVAGPVPLRFERQQGNNFVYAFLLGELRWGLTMPKVAAGLHPYHVQLSTDGGVSFTTVGKGAEPRRFVVGPALDCALFPDAAPPECPKSKVVGWAGDFGRYVSHACNHAIGLPNPVVFTKSALGHDCMILTADVWVAGLTDAGGSPGAIKAEVVTDISYGPGGPLATPVTYPLSFDRAVGNNYRFAWNVAQLVGMADRDDYTFRFRFSADGGATWFTIGAGSGPDGGEPRALHVRNDSLDIDAVQVCEDITTWDGASASFPACIDYEPDAQKDASGCDVWVNALGRGQWSHNGASMEWLEAYIVASAGEGEVLGAGMWVSYDDAAGAAQQTFSFGSQIDPGYWKTGFTSKKSYGGVSNTVLAFAFFVDVRLPSGLVERRWQSNGGANYTIAQAFSVPGWVEGIGSGSVEFAAESVGLFDPKHACVQ